MAIYIEGMDMPKKGCIKLMVLLCDGKVIETTSGCQPQPEEQNYKAVPVPPHGNLIEKHDVFKLISAFPEIDELLTYEFVKALYNLPIIIPAGGGENK